MGYPTPKLKQLRIAQRRKKLIALIRENPDYQQGDLAEMMGVNRSTVSRDLKEINEELNMQTVEDFMIHRHRILSEIQENKELCMERLKRLANSPHQGSRWMEEWNKLVEKEARIFGLYAPDKMMIKHSQEFSKQEKDAAVNAALGVVEDNPTIIDLTPQIAEETEGENDDSDSQSDGSKYDKSVFSIA
jgi:DNA-binding MarR family transcriptional regulator